MPSSSPAGASSNQPGAPASIYTPTAQPQFDQLYQQIVGGFPTTSGATPAGQNLPAATGAAYGNIVNNPGFQPFADASMGAGNPAFSNFAQASYLAPYLQTSGLDQLTAAGNNPYLNNAYQGAGTAYNIGQNLAPQIANQAVPQLQGAASQILQTGFDPQNALYDRTLNQVRDQAAAANAAAGVGTSPYGASVLGNTLSNFNIDWQNNQLGRQTQAGAAASGIDQAALGLGQGAANLAYTTGQMPSNVYTGNNQQIQQAGNYAGGQFGNANSVFGGGLQDLLAGSGAGYNAYNTQGGNVLSGLSNLTNLGNNQFQIPQQVLNDLQSYLGLGQSASQISGNLGALGLQEQQNAFSGLGGAFGAGSNALFGSGGIGGSGGLLGTGGAGLPGLFGGGAATAAGDFGGGGAALGVADSALPSALPALALGGSG